MKKKQRGGKENEDKGESSKESIIIFYECKKLEHIKAECPLLKKKEKKKNGKE